MPVAAAPASAPSPTAQAPQTEPAQSSAPAAAEKPILTVKLESFDAAAKAKVIREVKALLGCNLVEAKTLVEKAPTILKENVVKEVWPLHVAVDSNFQGCKEGQGGHRKTWRKDNSAIVYSSYLPLETDVFPPLSIQFAISP